MSKLFSPIQVGRMELSARLAMAPMTRFRVDENHNPLPMVKEYYEQRGSTPGTLLITEATIISPQAGGYKAVPGIYTDSQIAAWKEITDAVHAKGSYIYMQLWALGRVTDPTYLPKLGDYDVVSASDIPAASGAAKPRPLSESEIQTYIQDYAQAARNAVAAGFDGVEIHAANGYLIDQFIQDVSNQRTDSWGGSVENRARFALEITRAVADAIGADRTGIRFSPYSTFQGMRMADPIPQFTYLASEIAKLKLAYAHIVEPRIAGNADTAETSDGLEFFLEAYGNATPVIIAGGYKAETALEAIDGKYRSYDAVIGFGRPWTSNPDLPFRLKANVPLVPYNRDTFYNAGSATGYIDWDFSPEFKATQVGA
ncbi:chanoclavine-I aldehyde reductase fgaOx3 [Penicillium manginii]|jgi:NADPH2 dehydrogenase|uniref:chanoclavine-I aldehyde reductase fgaOx3 n=1 Tax=Penicillium manginii TaxID=203109 RepID=UPI002546AA58|nr:chanoclavine-I aldehyde reductase fgaOx3 [Penicillium manginii]KAJ5750457.1 chanoclavine-I aldehyde reductase fgaOx3 [Penicillium manginii]